MQSMDLVSPSEHLCYVRCTYCNTVLAVNSSRNQSRSSMIMDFLSFLAFHVLASLLARNWRKDQNQSGPQLVAF
jgi:uncharacterized membrane protein affecting hemolysin expression